MCQYQSWVFLGCQRLLGEQLLPVGVKPYCGAEAQAGRDAAGAGALHLRAQAAALHSCSGSSFPAFYCTTDFVLIRGGFAPQNMLKVVIRIQSSGVKQN